MRTPRRISELISIQTEYLDAAQSRLDKAIIDYQSRLLGYINEHLLPMLDIDESGNIKDNLKNTRLLQTIEKIYKDFTKNNGYRLGDEMTKTFDGITGIGDKYFIESLAGDLPEIFPEVIRKTKNLINLRLGLDGSKIVGGGMIERLVTNNDLLMEIKDFMSKAVTGGLSHKNFIKGLKEFIVGSDAKQGGYERQFRKFAHDIYFQYDAAYNKTLADRLDMTYFVYSGSLIKDSRDFCVAHKGKVFSNKEAEGWTTWTPAKGLKNDEFPETVNGVPFVIKQKDINTVPSYMSYAGYSPLVDRGGYNCRHILRYISTNLAERMRPDLNKNNL